MLPPDGPAGELAGYHRRAHPTPDQFVGQLHIRLRLTVPEAVTGVDVLVGSDAECRTDRGKVGIVLPELDLYEALRLRCD